MGSTDPQTLLECIRMFEDEAVAFEFFKGLRWPNGPACPGCGCSERSFLKTRPVFKCKACKKQYSVKKGTIFEDSPLGLDRWLPAIWLIANARNGTPSHELGRALGVTQRTAWFMLHRIRVAMTTGTFEKLKDTVEVDETFVGGKAKNMHRHKREEKIQGRGAVGKATVFGMMERGGDVRAHVVSDRSRDTVQGRSPRTRTGAPRSTPTPSPATRAYARAAGTRSLTTPQSSSCAAKCTRTGSRTSGRSSSGA